VGVAVDDAHPYWANFASDGHGTTIGPANLDILARARSIGALDPHQ
jgi:hypothetical protein